MLRFLFWNINRKPLEHLVATLTSEHEIDVVILAECNRSQAVLLSALNTQEQPFYHATDSQCPKLAIFTRFSRKFLKPIYESPRWTIRHLRLPGCTQLLLAAVHLPGKREWQGWSQNVECTELAKAIEQMEKRVGHTRTVLVGDLNMNPFEEGVFASGGLHAVMTKEIARRQARIVQGRPYSFFYNPMWGHFGDRIEGPPGTYYYNRSEHRTLFWHMFDQVLLRPSLLDNFREAELKILTAVGATSLLSAAGLPDATGASDHLPLLFSLDL